MLYNKDMRIFSWNVNGLRAVLKKGAFQEFLVKYDPDIICLQETKAKQGQAEVDLTEYEEIWNSAERAGYSGTAIFTKVHPLSVRFGMFDEQNEKFDWLDQFGDVRTEGRLATAEFDDFYLVNTYVPNAKDSLERLEFRKNVWDPALLAYMQELEKTKPVILCGDMNVAYEEIDLARPKQNVGHAGFTDEERLGMTNYLAAGFVDSFRFKNPEKVKYSWWSYRGQARANNVGWRIDYFLLSDSLKDKLVEADICDEVMGSDHCPVMIEVKDLSLNANMVEMEVVSPKVVLAEEMIEKASENMQAKLDLKV